MLSLHIRVFSYDSPLLQRTADKFVSLFRDSGANVRGPIPMPTETQRFVVNSSDFVDSKSKDAYRKSTYKRYIIVDNVTPAIMGILSSPSSETTQLLPPGVGISVNVANKEAKTKRKTS